ncbi:hypothetical protein Q7P35_011243 [Cladosporium inversicolor]
MPSKLDDSSNLQFLYACLDSGQFKRIDFQEVANEFGLSVPAARMRMRRLHNALGYKQLGDKQGGKVTKPKSAALGRKAKRVGRKTGAKEGLEVDWKGAEDDDDEEEIAGGKVERRRGGELKKEESEDDQAWKTLPEAVVPGTSGDGHSQATVLSPPPPSAAALHQDPLEVQPQTLLHHTSLPVPNTVSFEDNGNFLPFSNGGTYSPAHIALPHAQDGQAFLEDYQPYYLQ